ncbi:hypothetical protein [Lutispora sp.]|uniref:hypothetical protein n=1 Tax=Lutispora sp. TaxID=2828727 RepID=UPI002B1FB8CE|nr:hypothetical protein [Lutispora sp.]MEA4961838.1 hypothetical protein [Lutispora sp.]
MKISFCISKTKIVIIAAVIILTSFVILGSADGAIPGSESDPIVTLSFVEKKIDQIKYYIDSTTEGLKNEVMKYSGSMEEYKALIDKKDAEIQDLKQKVESALTFKVVQMKKGQILLAGEGSEIIIRSGKTTAVYGKNGGLSDITAAKDLQSGEAIVLNHMLISSREDGRGVKAEGDAFLIIKGGYILK